MLRANTRPAHFSHRKTAGAGQQGWLVHGKRPSLAKPSVAVAAVGALILEADGALTDLHMDGHRVAFNRAFHELGMDCANWTPAIYHDLLSKGDGTGEGLVRAYYNCVGWPTFLPSNEQEAFAGKVYSIKQQQMKLLIKQASIPLRDGVVQVLTQALSSGFRVGFIAETCSDPEDDVISSLLQQLPPDVAAQARVYSTSMGRQPVGEDADGLEETGGLGGSSGSSSLEASLSAAATRMKQKGAQEFVERLSAALAGKDAAVQVQIDPLLQQAGSTQSATVALLAAVAATLDVPAARCMTIASSSELINAAAAAGMVPVAIPRKMAYSASYPAAAAKFEGFGPGAATFNRLQALLQAAAQA